MMSKEEQQTINSLTANWIWVSRWTDRSAANTAGRVVRFKRHFTLSANPTRAVVHFTADTRYKLYVNDRRVAVGPARSSILTWYYDTLDLTPYLHGGDNVVEFVVVRYFSASRAAMPFARTQFPGLTVSGVIEAGSENVDIRSDQQWLAQVDESTSFPTGLIDDVFLHINERITPLQPNPWLSVEPYNIKTLNGELSPWRLQPRAIPYPEEGKATVEVIKLCQSSLPMLDWTNFFSKQASVLLPKNSEHTLEVQADVHSTAFLRWAFRAAASSKIQMKLLYSEGYELEPRNYPFFRSKTDRLDASKGSLIGPFDDVTLDLPESRAIIYEPFWFRTFRVLRVEIKIGSADVELLSFEASQVNYPLTVKGFWKELDDPDSEKIWEVSLRTMRNCMFDGYSDCPFYEQLQYAGDTRTVGLFHYLTCGDDRLMRQAITTFASSITPDGLTQSRFPSHVNQVIAGFSLYWILMVCDHQLFFGDTKYTRSFLPRIDGVLEFFDRHVDELGLVSGLPDEVWQFVDWVTTWGATDDHPDKGVPTSGRKTNRHTYFSMLYAYTLQQAAKLLEAVNRHGHAAEYRARSESLLMAIRQHCYDGHFFTDSTVEVADANSYSQHCQVFAVLSGAALPSDQDRILRTCILWQSNTSSSSQARHFSKCSYMMTFYTFRALSLASRTGLSLDLYELYWSAEGGNALAPWRRMLTQNLTTWEEDDVRQRSDCHAWACVPLYEYCTEVAGVRPLASGCSKILFKPRLRLTRALEAKVALGSDNVASVVWKRREEGEGETRIRLHLQRAVEVVSQLPGTEEQVEHGIVDALDLVYSIA